jgi:hypothetical protein
MGGCMSYQSLFSIPSRVSLGDLGVPSRAPKYFKAAFKRIIPTVSLYGVRVEQVREIASKVVEKACEGSA